LIVDAVITADRLDLLKRQGLNENLTEVHPLDFPFKTQIPNWRSCLTEAMGILRIGWKKSPKVENITKGIQT
jgi:hypothetical protein